MNLKNQKPVFVPWGFQAEMEKLSKAALMDMVWDLAQRCAAATDNQTAAIIDEIRKTAEIVKTHRKQAA